MSLFTVPENGNGINLMHSHSWVLVLFLFIVILIFTVVSLIIQRFILRKVRAEITVFTVSVRTVIIFMILTVVVPSPSMRSEYKSCWTLVVCRCCDIHVDDVAKIAENIVQEIKMFTKLMKILLHDLELLIQSVWYEIQCILLNPTIISLTFLTSAWIILSVLIRILSSSLLRSSICLLSSILLLRLVSGLISHRLL